MAHDRCGNLPLHRAVGALLAMVYLVGALFLMAMYSPLLTLAFLATTPLYVGLMIFSVKVLRPLFAGVEESQGKYSSHQIDAIKGIEAVKAASAESSFRDAMLNEFLSVSQTNVQGELHRDVVRQCAANHRPAFDCDLSRGSARRRSFTAILVWAGLLPSVH